MPHELFGGHIGSLKEVLEENKSTFGCTVEVGVQYLGGTTLPSSTLDEGIKDSVECALFCAGSSSCQFWTHDSDLQSCELSSSEPTPKKKPQEPESVAYLRYFLKVCRKEHF